jgi:hypothetical protein
MPFSTENNITNDRRVPNFLKPDPNKPNLVSLTVDYDGNVTTDVDMAMLSIVSPVGVTTTIDPISNTVIPKPPSFTPTQNPSIGFLMNKTLLAKNIKVAIGATPGEITYVPTPSLPSTDDRSPYLYPPIIDSTFLNLNNLVTGIGATNTTSPIQPVITKTSMRTEYDQSTQTIKNTTLVVGIGITGIIYIEEKTGNQIKLNSDLTGNVNGNVNSTGVSTFTTLYADNITGNVSGNVTGNVTGNISGNLTGNVNAGIVTATSISGNLTGNVNAGIVTATSISNGTNVLSFSVSGSDLTLAIVGIGSTTLKLA